MKRHPIEDLFERDGITVYSLDARPSRPDEQNQIEAFIAASRVTKGPTLYAAPTQHGPDVWRGSPVETPKRANSRWSKYWAKRRAQLGVKP